MAAELIEIHPVTPQPRLIERVVECLRNGGLIIYPTDTVYAMGCDIHNNRAVERLSHVKGMKVKKNNFSIICHDLSHIAEYAKVSNLVFKTMKKVLPGPYTFILPATNHLPKTLQTNRKSIGIRVPNHPIPYEIISALGNPIITTSLKDDNDTFIEYPNDIGVIYEQNKNRVDMIIDGGWCGIIASTVIDANTDAMEVVREGLGEVDF